VDIPNQQNARQQTATGRSDLLIYDIGPERSAGCGDSSRQEIPLLMTKKRRFATRSLRGWAISALQEAGAIRECETHGWMQERADPHARERAFDIARQDPPDGISAAKATAEIEDVLNSIGDTRPECPPDC
jgi:hypothetical protein